MWESKNCSLHLLHTSPFVTMSEQVKEIQAFVWYKSERKKNSLWYKHSTK